jgi:DNA-binding GntR family transcriptional regulator
MEISVLEEMDGPESSGLRRQKGSSLTEKIYNLLRDEIVTCELEPGRELSEAELAERFEVSKTPVREALASLRVDGFVHTYPRRGYQVVPITFGDMNELFELRTLLEAGAAELACQRVTPEELVQLEQMADTVYDRSEPPSLRNFIRTNSAFHLAIAKSAGNVRLYKQLARVLNELERFFYLGARMRDVSNETKSDHLEITKVLATRDPREARSIMIRHNEITRQGLVLGLTASKGLSQFTL